MLTFNYKNNTLYLNNFDEVIYSLKIGQEFITVSSGANSYKMSHGSFKISEQLSNAKVLIAKNIDINDNVATISLNQGIAYIQIENNSRVKVYFDGLDEFNRMWVKLPAVKEETVYGSGETFSEFNLRGKKVNVWVAEHINALQIGKKLVKQLVGVKNTKRKQAFSEYETYYAQPTFLSSRKYFYHSLTTARSEFDFSNDDFHIIKTDEIAPFYVGFGESFEDVLTSLTDIVGRQPELPDWVYDGQILGIQGGTNVMLEKVNDALKRGMKISGVWIQDWEGRRVTAVGKQLYWNWQWDDELYPELDVKIKELNEKSIKVLGYINPFLAVEKPLYKEATEKGYCVKDKDGKDYYVTITTFPAAMVDLTNPEAYEWLKRIIKTNMIDFGLSGWMADFGEYLPTDCVLHSGENPELIHNKWSSMWAKLNREAVEESGKLGEIFFFTRSGFSDSPKYSTLMWCGDNHVDFSIDFGLPSVIPAMLSMTCCGFGLSHSDIGGYTSFFNLKRSEELYMRWCEMNAFSPLMRGHEGLNPDKNAQFDASENVLHHGIKMGNVHSNLKPYLKECVKYNAENGVGVVRPLFFYYDEPEAYNEAYEYLLGRDILVAPVIEANCNYRNVYLPNDEWINVWSGEEFTGGNHIVDCDFGRIPVFVRKQAQDLIKVINNTEE